MPVSRELLAPMVEAWRERAEIARRKRQFWDDICDQCRYFYQGAVGFMWDESFRRKYLGNIPVPKFKLTIAKAFEFIAVIGPTLYWRNPERNVVTTKKFEMKPEYLGDPNDQNIQQMFQQMQQQEMQNDLPFKIANELMKYPLNYYPFEQPGGGLMGHSILAITESMIYGRGCLWTSPYTMPGSNRKLIGSFFGSARDLWVDPDCKDPTLQDALWIMRESTSPVWVVEEKYGWKPGSLREYANAHGDEAYVAQKSRDDSDKRDEPQYDSIRYQEFYSRGGCGVRFTRDMPDNVKDALDRAVGDYAYICITDDCPFPLNAPPDSLAVSSDNDIRRMFEWPVPTWVDGKWPVKCLDYYPRLDSPYPIPPLEPGLGELTLMNLLLSFLCGRIWSDNRNITAVFKQHARGIVDKIKNGGMDEVVEIESVGGQNEDINRIITQWIKKPVGADSWRLFEMISLAFDKRVGLTDLAYGLNPGGTTSRSAADINAKQSALSVRPQYMMNCVESFMDEVADAEKFCSKMFITGNDLLPLLGPTGAQMWDQYVVAADPELFVRSMRARVTANSARKPNKDREIANLQMLVPTLFPELSKHADITHDTNPLNALLARLGEANDFSLEGMFLGPRQPAPPPPPPPEMQQQMEQQNQLAMAQQQATIQKLNAESQLTMAKAQSEIASIGQGQQETQLEAARVQNEMQIEAARMQNENAIEGARMQQEMMSEQARMQMEVQKNAQAAQLRAAETQQKISQSEQRAQADLGIRMSRFELDTGISEQQGSQRSRQDEERHVQEMRQKEEDHELDMAIQSSAARTQARNQSKAQKNGNGKPVRK